MAATTRATTALTSSCCAAAPGRRHQTYHGPPTPRHVGIRPLITTSSAAACGRQALQWGPKTAGVLRRPSTACAASWEQESLEEPVPGSQRKQESTTTVKQLLRAQVLQWAIDHVDKSPDTFLFTDSPKKSRGANNIDCSTSLVRVVLYNAMRGRGTYMSLGYEPMVQLTPDFDDEYVPGPEAFKEALSKQLHQLTGIEPRFEEGDTDRKDANVYIPVGGVYPGKWVYGNIVFLDL